MKKKLTNRQVQAMESKERIRNQALELFKNTDFEAVPISDICRAAGMSVGSFYNYFSSKEELIMDSYASFDQFVEENLAHKKYDTCLEAVKDALYNLALSAETQGVKLSAQMFRIQLKSGTENYTRDTRFFNLYVNELIMKALDKKEIHSAYPAEEVSALLLRITRGTLYDWAVHGGSYSVTQRIQHDIEMILNTMMP